MNSENMGFDPNTLSNLEVGRKPEIGDCTLVELNGKTVLLYISDVQSPSELPENLQELLKDDDRNFRVVYHVLDKQGRSKAPIYDNLTGLQVGEETEFKTSPKSDAPRISLKLFGIYNDVDQAGVALNEKLVADSEITSTEDLSNPDDPTVLHINQ